MPCIVGDNYYTRMLLNRTDLNGSDLSDWAPMTLLLFCVSLLLIAMVPNLLAMASNLIAFKMASEI